MEVRPGYKQTEVGVIPEDWGAIRAGDACLKIQDGTHFSPRPGGNDYLYITSKNIRFGYLDISSAQRIDSAQHRAIYKRCDVKFGDLLLTKDGANTGNAALNSLNEEFSLLSSVAFLRFHPDKHSAAYFLQQILTSQGQRQIQDVMSGNAITRLTLEKINNLRFPVPPTNAEQEAIAEALSDADALIELLEQLIAKKRQIKQGAMQELLCPKNGWVEKKLGKTATLKARIGWQGLTTAEYLDSGDFYLVTGTDFKNGYIDWENCHYVAELRYKQDRNIQLKEHDVLVTKDGTIGKVALVSKLDKPATLNSGVFVIRPIEDAFYPDFFYYLLCSNLFTEFLGQLSAGSTINHLYQKDFVHFTYQTPATVDEQVAIATILSDMDTELAAFETKLAKTRQLKQGMMQELLTGRIRLVPPAIAG